MFRQRGAGETGLKADGGAAPCASRGDDNVGVSMTDPSWRRSPERPVPRSSVR